MPSIGGSEDQSLPQAAHDGPSVKLTHMFRTPLLLGVATLLLGNGLLGTLLSVRAGIEAFPTVAVGLIMSSYYLGYLAGSRIGPTCIHRVGHIRTFAAMAAIASAMAGLHAVSVEPAAWALFRAITGLCFAGLFVVMESWISARSTNANRGFLLAVYTFISLSALALGQQLLNLTSPAGFELFILCSLLISLSLVPFALTRSIAPKVSEKRALSAQELFARAPLGVAGCLGAGLTNGAFWGVGPLFAHDIGLPVTHISMFMSSVIIGGMALQLPIGRLSDRFDRRKIILIACLSNALLGIAIYHWADQSEALLFILAFAFGGFALTLYSLSVAHTNDSLVDEDIVQASSVLLRAFGVGALFGPFIASLLMNAIGPKALFIHIAMASMILAGFTIYHLSRVAPTPKVDQGKFVGVPETTHVVHRLDPRAYRNEERSR